MVNTPRRNKVSQGPKVSTALIQRLHGVFNIGERWGKGLYDIIHLYLMGSSPINHHSCFWLYTPLYSHYIHNFPMIPSGKHLHNYGKIHHFDGKTHYLYGHGFNSELVNYQRVLHANK